MTAKQKTTPEKQTQNVETLVGIPDHFSEVAKWLISILDKQIADVAEHAVAAAEFGKTPADYLAMLKELRRKFAEQAQRDALASQALAEPKSSLH
jgi:hypothetical protein